MLNFNRLGHAVQENCHISDAHYAGNYSMCIFLLKMREYYRWEHDIPFSQPLSNKAIGDWLVAREQKWEQFDSDSYRAIPLEQNTADPFDTDKINHELLPMGYVYSSGYGLFHKPYFFVGKLLKRDRYDDVTIYISSREYARDLAAPPAMVLGNKIFIRQESLRRFIWERIEEWQIRKAPDTPMARAIACYKPETGLDTMLDNMTNTETETMILHEVGEHKASKLLGPRWEGMLHNLQCSKEEIIVRSMRDHLADCLSTLPGLLERQNTAALHFYFANFIGMRKQLFPQALDAYQYWVANSDSDALYKICRKGRDYWRIMTESVLELDYEDKEGFAHALDDLINKSQFASPRLN